MPEIKLDWDQESGQRMIRKHQGHTRAPQNYLEQDSTPGISVAKAWRGGWELPECHPSAWCFVFQPLTILVTLSEPFLLLCNVRLIPPPS